MLLIAHYLAPSRIAGVGLFTAQPLRAGEPVYRCDPRTLLTLPDSELAAWPEAARHSLLRYLYRGRGADRLERAWYFCVDDARFFNHSATPNCRWQPETERYVAAHDLPADTELTCDYRDFTEPGDLPWLDTLSNEAVTTRA
jgi:SET domain-containing protein